MKLRNRSTKRSSDNNDAETNNNNGAETNDNNGAETNAAAHKRTRTNSRDKDPLNTGVTAPHFGHQLQEIHAHDLIIFERRNEWVRQHSAS